jgi:hypothetical protein
MLLLLLSISYCYNTVYVITPRPSDLTSQKELNFAQKNSILIHLMLIMANMEYIMLNIITGLVSIGYCYHNWLMLSQLVNVITLHPLNQISQIFFIKSVLIHLMLTLITKYLLLSQLDNVIPLCPFKQISQKEF